MEATAAELHAVIADSVHHTEEQIDPRTYVRQFPWAALGLAVGAGLAIGLTGADRKAASAAVDGAKGAGAAIGTGAVAAKDAVVEKFSGSNDLPEPVDMQPVVDGNTQPSGIRGKLRSAVDDLLESGLQEILKALGPAAQRAERAQMSVGATGSSVPVSNESSASDLSRAS